MLVQTLVAELAVEALDVRVLHGLARSDEREANPASVRPRVEHLAFELRPVVDGDRSRQPAAISKALEQGRDTSSCDRGVDLDDQTLAAVVVDDRETPQLA